MSDHLDIAIIGAGPGGLAAVIFLSRLSFAHVIVYEQAKELREIGAGISINQNTWRLLKLLGINDADLGAKHGDEGKVDTQQRNGRTGELLVERYQSAEAKPARTRIERYRLQQALLSKVPPGIIHLGKRLTKLVTGGGVRLEFEDGHTAGPFHIVVGADGIRSKVRAHAFPDHQLSYTGKVAFRTLIPQSRVAHLDLPRNATFWHHVDTHIYTDFLHNGMFEIATRAIEPAEHGNKVSWGQTVGKEQVVHHYENFHPTLRAVIDAPDSWLEFAIFGGSRLDTVISGDLALVGDAGHPLSGAFGSGAAFAFEDAFVLAEALRLPQQESLPWATALRIYDQVRGPRYKDLHGALDQMAKNVRDVRNLRLGEDAHIAEATKRNWELQNDWIYSYRVQDVWTKRLECIN